MHPGSKQWKIELRQVLADLPDSTSRRVILRGIARSMHEAYIASLESLREFLADGVVLDYPIATPRGYAQHQLLEGLSTAFRDIQVALHRRVPYPSGKVLGEILGDEPPYSAPHGSN